MSIVPDSRTISNISNNYFGQYDKEDDYFRLSNTFLHHYDNKKPNFGFNGLGEFVFYRTYSRCMESGNKEIFQDTLKRVVEGTYEIQRRHCRRLHIPWDYHRAQDSAQEMFERMWQFKFLPPGRGLWMMGTPFMWERGSAALNNCFRSTEKIITRDGIKPIGKLVGTTQILLSNNGKWVDAPIRSFGVQRLWKLTVIRAGVEKHIYTTENHNWFAKSSRRVDLSEERAELLQDTSIRLKKMKGGTKYQTITTAGLKPGMKLRSVFGQGIKGNVRPSTFGIAHGICFGDGTRGHDSTSTSSYIYLCGKKNIELLRYFNDSHTSFDPNKGKEGAMRVADIPRFFKESPSYNESKSYLYGWLAGYFAADGHLSKRSGGATITSSQRENLEKVADICAILGISTSPIRISIKILHSSGEIKEFLSYTISLYPYHLRREFFLVSHHRDAFDRLVRKSAFRHSMPNIIQWRVKSVEETDIEEEVYCAQVPDYHAFTLDGNILTGNCGYCSTSDQIESDPAEPFCFLMDMAMLGVGVGFDAMGADKIFIRKPAKNTIVYTIADSREGWVDSVRKLIWSYTIYANEGHVEFDYSQIRPAGASINGFGGKASGPGILMELHDLLRDHLEHKTGSTLSSVDIVDLMNYIGRCVVAGNVRRCLPKGTLVHLKRGLVPIEKVQIGDSVLTTNGYYPVAENVYQGKQNVLTIKTQMGPFRCTARHRIAVMSDIGEYEWKRANELSPGDKMVFVDDPIPGTETVLPRYTNFSQRANQLIIPGLTDDVAWLLGYLHGDGYVYTGRQYQGRKHHGASVMFPINRDEYHDDIETKIHNGIDAFGNFTIGEQPSQDNCHRIRIISSNLTKYFYTNFKKAKKPLNVPECVRMGTVATRAAYLAGLLDSDGSTKNRPTTLLSSVYNDFVRQVQAIYSSLGIPTKFKLRKPEDEEGQAKWELNLVGDFAINKFKKIVQQYAVKTLPVHKHASGNDFGFPSEWITRDKVDYGRSWDSQAAQMTYNRAVLCEAETKSLVPIEVELVVDEGIECETYDLSIPDKSEFVAQGLLVHNTAELALGAADDEEYCAMKNPTKFLLQDEIIKFYEVVNQLYAQDKSSGTLFDFANTDIPVERLAPALRTWNALNHHRWASNNSVFADVGMDYRQIAEQIAVNGEPGLMWLNNMRDYGRMIDGRQPGIDGRVMGANPCFAGSMRLFTEAGYISMYDLWLAGGSAEYQGTDDSIAKYGAQKIINHKGIVDASRVYRTGVETPIYRVVFDDNSWIDATENHQMIVLMRQPSKKRGKTKYVEARKNLIELMVGDMIPLNQTVHFGVFHDPAYAELAGWCIGDGSLSPKKDGQVRAECTCYEEDAQVVLPKLRGLLHELYISHNKSSNQNPAYAGWVRDQEYFEHHEERIGSNVLGRLLNSDGVRSGNNIPASIWKGTRETVAAFLRGFASADGYTFINEKTKTISVRISQSNQKFLCDCRLLLTQFGIASSIYKRRDASKQMMNDGAGGKKLYNRKSCYELIISGSMQVRRFLDYIGFIQDTKMAAAREWLSIHLGSNNSQTGQYVKVKSITYLGKEDTYCLTEPDDNRVVIEGYQVGQCLEQSLESYELCCLVETFPSNHDNADEYMRTLKFAYLYAKTVTLLPTHHARTNAVMLRNRRIGLSQSGIVQAFSKFGRRTVLQDFCDAGYNEIRRWDNVYAEWLCVQPSIKVTSVKPSGTVSLVAGVTPGIHYPEASTYWRRVRISTDSILVRILREAGYHLEPMIGDEQRTVVARFGVSDERVKSVSDISVWEQVQNVVDYQKYWADNQVSCTVKFKRDDADKIHRILECFEDQLKGISFLPLNEHGYAQAPYEACSPEEVEEYNNRLLDANYIDYIEEPDGSKYCDGDNCEVSYGSSQ